MHQTDVLKSYGMMNCFIYMQHYIVDLSLLGVLGFCHLAAISYKNLLH